MKRIKLFNKIYDLCCNKTYVCKEQGVHEIIKFIQNNYRRRHHKSYQRKEVIHVK